MRIKEINYDKIFNFISSPMHFSTVENTLTKNQLSPWSFEWKLEQCSCYCTYEKTVTRIRYTDSTDDPYSKRELTIQKMLYTSS